MLMSGRLSEVAPDEVIGGPASSTAGAAHDAVCAALCDYSIKSDEPRECSPVKRIAISTSLSASVSNHIIV